MEIYFTVPGKPIAKQRPRFYKRGASVGVYTPKQTTDYESLIKTHAKQSMNGGSPLTAAVSVLIKITTEIPQSWSAKKRQDALSGMIRPTTKPDIDNVMKSILDACNGVVYDDDKQVISAAISKKYGEPARVEVWFSSDH